MESGIVEQGIESECTTNEYYEVYQNGRARKYDCQSICSLRKESWRQLNLLQNVHRRCSSIVGSDNGDRKGPGEFNSYSVGHEYVVEFTYLGDVPNDVGRVDV